MKKWINAIVLAIFCSILIIPMLFFNFEKNAVSEIDNRILAENPFEAEGDLTENIEQYVNDRIGLRNEMILAYTVLNDKLFSKMEHPSYTYGKDGYIFGAGLTTDNPFTDFHVAFANMVKQIQTYCQSRNVPFLFVFNPAKPAVLTEYIAEGVNYDRAWVTKFFEELDKLGVHYLDNTQTLRDLSKTGEVVFNKKYDANHWNALGAYYGTRAALTEIKKAIPTVHIVEREDLNIRYVKKDTLLVSKFPIDEKIPHITIKEAQINRETEKYKSELAMHSNFKTFEYCVNQKVSDAPKALVFQGSYMNGYGFDYFANAFSEYISIHDYQNIINFPYYYNIFQPECVVFEVAEYTFSNYYFNYENMKKITFNPVLETIDSTEIDISREFIVEEGQALTKIKVDADLAQYAWLTAGNIAYDMQRIDTGYEVTILTEEYVKYKDNIEVSVMK